MTRNRPAVVHTGSTGRQEWRLASWQKLPSRPVRAPRPALVSSARHRRRCGEAAGETRRPRCIEHGDDRSGHRRTALRGATHVAAPLTRRRVRTGPGRAVQLGAVVPVTSVAGWAVSGGASRPQSPEVIGLPVARAAALANTRPLQLILGGASSMSTGPAPNPTGSRAACRRAGRQPSRRRCHQQRVCGLGRCPPRLPHRVGQPVEVEGRPSGARLFGIQPPYRGHVSGRRPPNRGH